MDNTTSLSTYVIHSDEEPLRLERQARLYGTADDLDFTNLRPGQQLLDAGCGSGTAARMFAKSVPSAIVTGVDRNATYLEFAQRQARSEAVANASFQLGDVLSLPFNLETAVGRARVGCNSVRWQGATTLRAFRPQGGATRPACRSAAQSGV